MENASRGVRGGPLSAQACGLHSDASLKAQRKGKLQLCSLRTSGRHGQKGAANKHTRPTDGQPRKQPDPARPSGVQKARGKSLTPKQRNVTLTQAAAAHPPSPTATQPAQQPEDTQGQGQGLHAPTSPQGQLQPHALGDDGRGGGSNDSCHIPVLPAAGGSSRAAERGPGAAGPTGAAWVKGAAKVQQGMAKVPFSTEDTILLVGEAALAEVLGDAELVVATSLDTAQAVTDKYPDAARHLASFKDLGGQVLHGVDATRLMSCKELKARPAGFTKHDLWIHSVTPTCNSLALRRVQNSPSLDLSAIPLVASGAGIKDQDHNILSNQRLLASFFAAARPLLTTPAAGPLFTAKGPITPPSGQVMVTLKSGLPYDEWKIVELAKAAGYFASGCLPFNHTSYPGYEHRRTIGWDATKEKNAELEGKACRTWIFSDRRKVLAAKAHGIAKRKAQQRANKAAARDDSSDDSD
ncbi:DUF2431 domain-containing protein [Haematococcus lacustris]|uniref:DUF2431 domain-containing protein n=1 Tax=Haematococcus lacustris TaxID=44745 RepID=A0A699YQM3_HAELA|nr:DUF2431 domain-containing protein [Haematococcus lacustris]